VQVRGQNIKVTLWDTAGQERYKSLSKVYYKGASGVLIVYDVTDPQSYLDVESWMRLACILAVYSDENLNLNEVVMMIVGNKIDMENERKVPT
jgi:small GTP-binding protein